MFLSGSVVSSKKYIFFSYLCFLLHSNSAQLSEEHSKWEKRDLNDNDQVLGYDQEDALGDETLLFEAKKNFQKSLLFKVASITDLPGQKVSLDDRKKMIGSGFSFKILNEMAQFFNFSYEICVPEEEGYGTSSILNGTEKWNGLIGMLVEKKVDFAAATFRVISKRLSAVDFSSSLFDEEYGILIKKPKEKDNTGAIAAPFSKLVWILILVVSCLMGFVLYALLIVQKRFLGPGTELEANEMKSHLGLVESIWFVYSGLVKQGSDVDPNFDSTRIFFSSWWIFAMLIAAFYTANLTAFLTAPEYIEKNTLESLLANGRYKWIIHNNSAIQDEIKFSNYKEFRMLRASLKNGQEPLVVNNHKTAEDLVLRGGYIFLDSVMNLNGIVLEHHIETLNCELTTAGYTFFNRPVAFAFQKGFKYERIFNLFIKKTKSIGLMKKWSRETLPISHPCAPSDSLSNDDSINTSMTWHDFGGAFTAYGCGLCIGLALLGLEWLNKRAANRRANRASVSIQPELDPVAENRRRHRVERTGDIVRTVKIKTIYPGQ